MTRALVDLLLPANSIDECARQIAAFHQKAGRIFICVCGEVPYTPLAVLASRRPCRRQSYHLERIDCSFVATGAQTQRPLSADDGQPATSLKEAIDRVRHHEAAGLAGGHVSALYHQVPHRVLDRLAAKPPAQNRSSGARGKEGGGSGSGRAKGRSSSNNCCPPSGQGVLAPHLRQIGHAGGALLDAQPRRTRGRSRSLVGRLEGQEETYARLGRGRRLRVTVPRCFVRSTWEL